MELIVTYLIYILGIIAALSITFLTVVRIKGIETKADLLKELIKHGYETDNIDLNKYIK